MIFRAVEHNKRVLVIGYGELVQVQMADCGEMNGENLSKAQGIADTLTVVNSPLLWGMGPGMSLSPLEPMVWLEYKKQPVAFEGATLDQAIAKAARRIRGES